MKELLYKERSRKVWWIFILFITVLYLWMLDNSNGDNLFPVYFIFAQIGNDNRYFFPYPWKIHFKEALLIFISYFTVGMFAFFILSNFKTYTIYSLIDATTNIFIISVYLYFGKIMNEVDKNQSNKSRTIEISIIILEWLFLIYILGWIYKQYTYPLERMLQIFVRLGLFSIFITGIKFYIHKRIDKHFYKEGPSDFIVENLSYKYKKYDAEPALQDVTFSVEQGEVLGIIGPHGAGKTTLMKFISKEIRKNKQLIYFKNETIDLNNLGYVPVDFPFKKFGRIQDIVYTASVSYEQWNQDEFDHYAARYNLDTEMKVKELSLGMQQRLMIAIALSHEADLIVMDEPTDGIDGFTREDILRDIQDYNYKYDATIIIATHQVEFYENILDKIVYLNNGNVELETDIITFTQDHGTIKEYILEQSKEV